MPCARVDGGGRWVGVHHRPPRTDRPNRERGAGRAAQPLRLGLDRRPRAVARPDRPSAYGRAGLRRPGPAAAGKSASDCSNRRRKRRRSSPSRRDRTPSSRFPCTNWCRPPRRARRTSSTRRINQRPRRSHGPTRRPPPCAVRRRPKRSRRRWRPTVTRWSCCARLSDQLRTMQTSVTSAVDQLEVKVVQGEESQAVDQRDEAARRALTSEF